MSYLPKDMPSPIPTVDDAVFWQACQEERLVVRRCKTCAKFYHPPLPTCPNCGSPDVTWEQVSGFGTVYTYTIGHHAVHPALKGHAPYNVSIVLLDDADDVRLISNVVDVPNEEMHIGLPVEVHFEPAGNGQMLPRFRRRVAQGGAA